MSSSLFVSRRYDQQAARKPALSAHSGLRELGDERRAIMRQTGGRLPSESLLIGHPARSSELPGSTHRFSARLATRAYPLSTVTSPLERGRNRGSASFANTCGRRVARLDARRFGNSLGPQREGGRHEEGLQPYTEVTANGLSAGKSDQCHLCPLCILLTIPASVR